MYITIKLHNIYVKKCILTVWDGFFFIHTWKFNIFRWKKRNSSKIKLVLINVKRQNKKKNRKQIQIHGTKRAPRGTRWFDGVDNTPLLGKRSTKKDRLDSHLNGQGSTPPETFTSASTWLSFGSNLFLHTLTEPHLIPKQRSTLYLENSLFWSFYTENMLLVFFNIVYMTMIYQWYKFKILQCFLQFYIYTTDVEYT